MLKDSSATWQGISEPVFYGDLVYTFKRIIGKRNFSDQFKKIIKRYKKSGTQHGYMYHATVCMPGCKPMISSLITQPGVSGLRLNCGPGVGWCLLLNLRFSLALWVMGPLFHHSVLI